MIYYVYVNNFMLSDVIWVNLCYYLEWQCPLLMQIMSFCLQKYASLFFFLAFLLRKASFKQFSRFNQFKYSKPTYYY